MSFKLKRIATGEVHEIYRIYAVCNQRGDCQLEDFLADPPAYEDAILRCIADAARVGPQNLGSKRAHFMDQPNNIYEFIGGRLRVAYFTDEGKIVICSHGFLKQSQETKKQDKKTARKAKLDYFDAKCAGNCEFIELEEEDQ